VAQNNPRISVLSAGISPQGNREHRATNLTNDH